MPSLRKQKHVYKTSKCDIKQIDKEGIMTPLKAIKSYCIGCSGDSKHEVKECPIKDCELYNFRFGKGPKKNLTDEQRQKLRDRFVSNVKIKEKIFSKVSGKEK